MHKLQRVGTTGFIIALAIGMGIFGTTSTAHANPMKLRIFDGTTTLLVQDEDFTPVAPNTDPDAFAGAGGVSFSGSIGTWALVVSVGTSKPLIGPGRLDLFSISVSGGIGTLDVDLSDTGYVNPGSHPGLILEVGGTTDGTLTVSSFLDTSNALFGMGSPGPTLGPFVGPGAFSGSLNAAVTPGGIPYSLTLKSSVTHTSPGDVTSFDANLQVVPEPGTLLLLGSGLLSLGVWGVRKSRKKDLSSIADRETIEEDRYEKKGSRKKTAKSFSEN